MTLRCWGSLADGSRWIAVEPPPAESLNPPEFFGITLFLHLLFIRSASVQAVLFLFLISLSNFLYVQSPPCTLSSYQASSITITSLSSDPLPTFSVPSGQKSFSHFDPGSCRLKIEKNLISNPFSTSRYTFPPPLILSSSLSLAFSKSNRLRPSSEYPPPPCPRLSSSRLRSLSCSR